MGDFHQDLAGATNPNVYKFLHAGHPPIIDHGVHSAVQGYAGDVSEVPAVPNERRVISISFVVAVTDTVFTPSCY
jgi:hypothetical protein